MSRAIFGMPGLCWLGIACFVWSGEGMAETRDNAPLDAGLPVHRDRFCSL